MSNEPAVIEVKKHAMRQTQEGSWLLTLSLSQEDVPLWLFTAPMGQRMAIAELTIIAEQPQGANSGPVATSPTGAADQPPAATDGGSTAPHTSASTTPQAQARGAAEPATKPKRHWDTIPPSQQAGVVCKQANFAEWCEQNAPEHNWKRQNVGDSDVASPRYYVRWYCGVTSRADLDTNPDAAARWRELYGRFEADTRYGGSVR